MKSTFVKITVLSPTPVGSTKLNLFEVAVGPWHFDYPIIVLTYSILESHFEKGGKSLI